MNASQLWIIYFIILLILIILSLFFAKDVKQLNMFYLISFLVSAVMIFISLLWVEDTADLWVTSLILIAFILPIMVVIYLASVYGDFCQVKYFNDECITVNDCTYH